jgi:2-polyprenyl-3-methyl-5-hydroxy-6-metoxy-1,4-benzoquinol methylase
LNKRLDIKEIVDKADMKNMNTTLDFYNENADDFVIHTRDVDFKQTQDRFANKIPTGGRILDFGCGSGRDTKYFIEQGFCVDAVDGSEKICEIASAYTGITVKKMLFQELDAVDLYDGIWACSSILHLPKAELKDVFKKMCNAVKSDGIIYTSFKYGMFEGIRNGRYFTDFTEETFPDFMEDFPGMKQEELWITKDVRPDRGEEKWLNLILRKWDTV